MNKNNKKNHMPIALRAKKSILGRIVCRVAGEETGAVMMEYVIVATLIAAAVAVAVFFFGADIANMFASMGDSVRGDNTQSITTRTNAKTAHDKAVLDAATARKEHIEDSREGSGDAVTGN